MADLFGRWGEKTAYQKYQENKKKEKPKGAPIRKTIQYSEPNYTGKSATRSKAYEWEKTLLKPLPSKQFGRSYNDKYDGWAKSQGLSPSEAIEFRTWMDSKEDKDKDKNSIKVASPLDAIMKKSNEKADERLKQFNVKPEATGLERISNFITSKDTNPNDGKREGMLGFMDNYGMRASKAMQNVILDPLGTNNFEENQTKNFKQLAKNNQASQDPSKQKRGNELEKILKGSEGEANTKGEKAAELLGTGLGIASYILPGSASEMVARQGLNALKLTKPGSSLASKLATQSGEKGLSAIAKAGGRSAGKGAASGLVFGAGETGLRELVDGDSQSAGENLQRIGKEVAFGAIGNPVLDALGSAVTKGLGKLPKNNDAIPSLPKFNGQVSEQTLNKLRPNQGVNNVVDDLENIVKPNELTTAAENITPSLDRLKVGKNFEAIIPKESNIPVNIAKEQPLSAIMKKVDNKDLASEATQKALQQIKDIKPFQVATQNIYQLADRLPKPLKERITTTLDTAKKANIDTQEQLTNDLFENVVKRLGIKKGTKDSALVQDFGEKTLAKDFLKQQGIDYKTLSEEELNVVNLQRLQQKYPDKWENIVEADKYFRNQYDQLINRVNEVRASLYPGKADKLVPKRSDYYHHFNELEGFEGIKNLFETPGNIDPKLEGVSPFTQPKTKWQSFMQKRGNGKYKKDAVGGYLKYLQAASHSINIDPVIPVVRKTANDIAEATTETRNANKIIEALEYHAKDLAGKTNPYDRLLQTLMGRDFFGKLNALNSRVKSNMIVGNLSSVLGQAGNVPLGIGKVKQYAAPGLADTLTQTANQVLSKTKLVEKNIDAPIYKSEFMKERYADQFYKRFDQRLIEQPKKLALWMMETVDKSSTSFIWNSMYRKGLGLAKQAEKAGKEVIDPIKYADTETRNVVAGRGVGEVPLGQKSKTAQIFIPFTLEVGNQWTVLRKMVGEKDAAGLMTFLIASYGLNKAMEEVRGSGVSFDPAGAAQEGYTKTEGGTGEKVLGGLASLNGEVVGNIPGGNLLTQMVDTEKKVPVLGIQYKELFGERNPNRFGSGLTISKAAADPLYAALPWGASQVRKTAQGLDAIRNEAVYKGDNNFNPFNTPKSELKYPVERNTVNDLKNALTGPSSTDNAKEYYDNKRMPLTEIQTDAYKRMDEVGLGDELYSILRESDATAYEKGQITKIEKDNKLSDTDKTAKLKAFIKKLQDKRLAQ